MACINTNHPDYLKLIEDLALRNITNPVSIQAKIMQYQELNGTTEFPDLDFFITDKSVIQFNKVNNQEELTKVNGSINITDSKLVKEGVDFVFEQNPELVNIGSKQAYSQYLDTIFPDSKIRDIVYHGTSDLEGKTLNKKQSFKKHHDLVPNVSKIGFWFSKEKITAKLFALDALKRIDKSKPKRQTFEEYTNQMKSYYEKYPTTDDKKLEEYDQYVKWYSDEPYILSVLLNIKTPKIFKNNQEIFNELTNSSRASTGAGGSLIYNKGHIDALMHDKGDLNYENYDNFTEEEGSQILVFEPEQIHILGSQDDIDGFKKFVGNIPQGYTRLYRSEDDTTGDSAIPDWIKESDEYKAGEEAKGRWFYKTYEEAQYHANKFGSSGISYVDIPTNEVENYNAKDNKFSGGYGKEGREYFVSKEIASRRKPYNISGNNEFDTLFPEYSHLSPEEKTIVMKGVENGDLSISCTGGFKAAHGVVTSTKLGSKWSLVKDLKGYNSHEYGGVDININNGSVTIGKGDSNVEAANGLIIFKV